MECNKDEALRAKEIAEKKFVSKDIAGARKFALKAQNLFPGLDGVSQMIATLDVHLASELKVGGEKDWYSILSVNPSADDDTVKKQYRKLALQLHPDKNKSVGAESAFQFISEAWNVLSDKSKRTLYDHKRNIKGFQQKTFQTKKESSVPHTANGFYNFVKNTAQKEKAARQQTAGASRTNTVPPPPNPEPPKSNTFWTSCNKCKMQYEYLRIYLNHNLLCPNCHEPFLASETAAPTNGINTNPMRRSNTQQNQKNSKASGPGKGTASSSDNKASFQWGPFSRKAGAASAKATSTAAAQAANMVHQTYEKVRREREEAQARAKREEILQRKLNSLKKTSSSSGNSNIETSDSLHAKKRKGGGDNSEPADSVMGPENAKNRSFGSNTTASEMERVKPTNLNRGSSQLDIRSMLMEKSKVTLNKVLEDWNSKKVELEEKERAKKKQKVKENDEQKGKEDKQDKLDDNANINIKRRPSSADLNDEVNEPVLAMEVPDPDFYDFDGDRSEKSFRCDQIWATYDEEDGMPRYYALIQKVISLNPFKIRMSYLTSKSNIEFGPLNWTSSGFAKTCGDFRVGRYEVIDTVRWEKAPRGFIKIFPKKGDIWALYRNWSADWNEHTPDEVIYKYDMVEVLDEYNEVNGISVIPLVKIGGFKTVFKRHTDPKEVKRIPKEEMFRFSHQVPSYLLTGEEAQNAPKGCRELDPAATPLELLQLASDISNLNFVFNRQKYLRFYKGRVQIAEIKHCRGEALLVVFLEEMEPSVFCKPNALAYCICTMPWLHFPETTTVAAEIEVGSKSFNHAVFDMICFWRFHSLVSVSPDF
ncbi:DnaJ subfamily B member 12 [Ananas comosus]|uniref:DnaJ subfamily B member 12 n=1 Tax=Ananas comosus TaxID=4615 RepID=A0A199VEX3_ANACO|nr:DnaJ subfamily B member 12 [Ananas comosus]